MKNTIIVYFLSVLALALAAVELVAVEKPEKAQLSVSVRGCVGKPGTVEFAGSTTKMDLLDAVAKAGGFKRIGDKRYVVIIRNYGMKNEHVNVYDVRNLDRPLYVLPGDVIHVPQRRV